VREEDADANEDRLSDAFLARRGSRPRALETRPHVEESREACSYGQGFAGSLDPARRGANCDYVEWSGIDLRMGIPSHRRSHRIKLKDKRVRPTITHDRADPAALTFALEAALGGHVDQDQNNLSKAGPGPALLGCPFLPVRWEDINVAAGSGIPPSGAKPPAGKSKGVNFASWIDDGKPKVPVNGHVRNHRNAVPPHKLPRPQW
jgi:hypothetical protein